MEFFALETKTKEPKKHAPPPLLFSKELKKAYLTGVIDKFLNKYIFQTNDVEEDHTL